VIYTGTFSKVLFPSLRLSYVVVPDALLDQFIELKYLSDDHLPLLDQATLALFLESGAFYSHIRRCRREYAARHKVFLELFARTDLPLTFEHTMAG
jgi:GntR family transcriptional regulator/MocR family aminotransferase